MKFLFLLLVSITSAADYYWKYASSTINAAPIKNAGTTDTSQLESLCSQNSQCAAFNSVGLLFGDVQPAVWNLYTDLYIKQNASPEQTTFIWPLPQSASFGSSKLAVDPNSFQIIGSPSSTELNNTFEWFTSLIFPHSYTGITHIKPRFAAHPAAGVTLPALYVYIENINVPLQLGVDESYSLNIPSDGSAATLRANTTYGALAGLQSFSQLVIYDFESHTYYIPRAPWQVFDFPRYAHRGLLLDTTRHFHPLSVLYKVIDSLSFAKFNVLHWHMTDSTGIPLEFFTYPYLWNSSYSTTERYTQDDVAAVIDYARQRGVRVMMEIDTPGHAGSFCTGYPEVCPSMTCKEPLNPATEATFTLLQSIFTEVTNLFFDDFFHLGGDEVNTDCWVATPSIDKWLKDNRYTPKQAYLYFVNRTFDIAINLNRSPVNWEEVYDNFGTKLNPRAVVHAWFNKATVAKASADGYRTLNSDGWYLDHLGDLWTDYYNNDPADGITSPKQAALVLGGEACMWGETVDPSDIFNTIWPRAAAVAERLWSASTVTDTLAARPRYENFRCLLTQRGIGAAPANNPTARQAPPAQGTCYIQ